MALLKKLDKKVTEVLDEFSAAYDAKDQMGFHSDWRTYEDYVRGIQNPTSSDEDIGSVTNVIFPVIASQIADLVDEPQEISVVGEEPSDQIFSSDLRHILEWIDFKNRMPIKMDRGEWRRLKMGTVGWKVYYDPTQLRGRGMIVIDPISPVNLFPDPKIKEAWQIDEGDFFDHATFKPINYLRRVYGSAAQDIDSKVSSQYDLTIFDDEDNEDVRAILQNKALVIERWYRKGNLLSRRVIANETLLYDSQDDPKMKGKAFYEGGRYPFVMVPCYPVEGRLWGMGDVELLIPTQDMINELDDQIRMNAKLMGNLQIVVGMASGINIKKWTNKAGLKIPARDPSAWKEVVPPNMPSYILQRRAAGFQEAELISGRPDSVEGRRSGGVRAASAILALQEAGSRRARHKKLFLQEGLSQVYEICVDYVKQFFTEEEAYRVLGKDPSEAGYIWFKGSKLKAIPRLIPDGQGGLKELAGKTKDAQFDIRVSLGAGLPHNKAFLFQTIIELSNTDIITREEARGYLKDMLDWPVIDPNNPIGTFAGKAPVMPGMPGDPMGGQPVSPDASQIPPDLMMKIVAMLGGVNNNGGGPMMGGY